ncbi:MAG: hypothetical protein O2954_04020, partial [bacterium]|nr:hypothetical protein [bacterium]
MEITDEQIAHFHRSGFFLIPNPLDGETMFEADRLQRKNEAVWERTEWPKGVNRLACQFLMLGDLALEMVERPELVNAAKRILGCDEVHVGACGLGDASKASSAGERPVRQVSWHADGSPEVHQVSFRTAL